MLNRQHGTTVLSLSLAQILHDTLPLTLFFSVSPPLKSENTSYLSITLAEPLRSLGSGSKTPKTLVLLKDAAWNICQAHGMP